MLVTRGLGPTVGLAAFGFGPFTSAGVVVIPSDATPGFNFFPQAGTFQFEAKSSKVRFNTGTRLADFSMRVDGMTTTFIVPTPVVRFNVRSTKVTFMVPPGTVKGGKAR